ncbi:hypothetical protein BFG07_13435 [Kosakonia cowanii]|uniref:hypothetical protein n=1 Tax=Kosakonia cowanii TaxID=208223 RepID=UPI000B970E9E|nr:hypothetical protein [Kosakonia cowanii]AST69597.1 hypothetical protein BFG07_13435 [Kosakonia cowanii]
MKSLSSFINNDHFHWLELALSAEKKGVSKLRSIKENVSQTYLSYDEIVRSINAPLPSSIFDEEELKQLKESYIDLYAHPTVALKKILINKRKDHELEECPYCGNPTIPDTLDHFIPKTALAEYAIYPNNLVPQCKFCAPIKGSSYIKNNESLFLHPFYSALLDTIIIEIKSSFRGGDYLFDVKFRSSAKNAIERKLIVNHISSLKIKTRIELYCYSEVKKWERKLSRKKFDIVTALQTRINEYVHNEHTSNWELILYNSILDEPAVIRHLKSIKPKVKKKRMASKKMLGEKTAGYLSIE